MDIQFHPEAEEEFSVGNRLNLTQGNHLKLTHGFMRTV
jgi:hypothetical protein